MLPRDSARWAELRQAYGTAEDIPRLLDALDAIEPGHEGDAGLELWYGAWATLCPDDTVHEAAYAAAPHLAAWAHSRSAPAAATALHLLAEMEGRRAAGQGAPIPADLVAGYAGAVELLPALVAACMREAWSADVAQIMAAALVAGQRQGGLARAILALDDAAHG